MAPNDKWGYFKVPGSWPGITDYMQKDSQTVHAHPSWKDKSLSSINTAWYQREITIPGGEERLFKVIYKEDSGVTGKPRNLKYKMRVAARRLLSELRDECMFYKGVLDG